MINTIKSTQNDLVKHLCKLRLNGKYREEQKRVLICGSKMVKEVCNSVGGHNLLLKTGEKPPSFRKPIPTTFVTDTILEKISGMPSMVAEVELPNISTTTESLENKKFVLVLDTINDPGNLGTLIRTGYNLGWDSICIVGPSVDPFNDKAIRAAKGCSFFSHITSIKDWSTLHSYIKEKQPMSFVAEVNSKQGKDNFNTISGKSTKPNPNIKSNAKQVMLILSNESHGASGEAKAVSQPITIPMMESPHRGGDYSSGINVSVAGGILLLALKQWKVKK